MEAGREGEEAGERRRGEGLTCGGCCRWRRCWRRQTAALVMALAVHGGRRWLYFFLFFLSSVFHFFLCFFFFFFLLSLFSSPPFGLPPSLFFSPPPPIFIGKNRGGMWLGRPLCCRPKNCPRNTSPPSSPTRGKLRANGGGVSVFLKREMAVTEEEKKSSSSPASHVQGKKKTHSAFKTTPFWVFPFFFNEQCMKRLRFGQNVSFHLNENGAKLMLKYKSVLNL
jgi:hypothetical protein